MEDTAGFIFVIIFIVMLLLANKVGRR